MTGRWLRTDTARGFSLLELSVALVVIGVVVAVLLDRLLLYEEQAEKAQMVYVTRMLEAAVRIRMGELLVAGNGRKLESLPKENPFDWLAPTVRNYGGELKQGELDRAAPGKWYYDTSNGYAVYLVADRRHFRSARQGSRMVRYRVELMASPLPSGGSRFEGARLQLAEGYEWF